jgi:outer membrane receptor for ferrienterochelin and colicins
VTVVAKGRLENHSAFGLRAMPGVAVMASPVEGLTLRASYGTGFKAPPTFSKLTSFCPDEGLYEVIQNPALMPERSQGGNLSAEYAIVRNLSVSASLFRNDIRDMITESLVGRDTVTRVWRYQHFNRGTVVTQGAEMGASFRPLSGLLFRVGYSLLDASDREAGEPLPYRPRHTANWLASWDSRQLDLDVSLGGELTGSMPTQRREGDRLVAGPDSPAYTVWNGRVTKRFGTRYSAFVAVNNLFGFVQREWLDEDVPLWGPNRGRYIVAGLKLSV